MEIFLFSPRNNVVDNYLLFLNYAIKRETQIEPVVSILIKLHKLWQGWQMHIMIEASLLEKPCNRREDLIDAENQLRGHSPHAPPQCMDTIAWQKNRRIAWDNFSYTSLRVLETKRGNNILTNRETESFLYKSI